MLEVLKVNQQFILLIVINNYNYLQSLQLLII